MTLGSHFLVQRGSPLMGIARAEKPRIETLPAKRFHTWGNSGLEPYLGSGNQLSSIDEAQHGLCNHGGTAMEHYVGLDVSLKLTAICIIDRTEKIAREGVVTSGPETIAAFIKSHAPHVARIGLETGATSTWLWT
jgi:hypothetical protein